MTGRRRWKVARVVAFLIVLFGATIVPLAMEVIWRSEGDAALHVQPEVLVVEQAGDRAAHGQDPYRVVDRNGHIVIHEHTEPVYELYYPYLPGMVVFGFSTGSRVEARLTDARIQFLLFTAVIGLLALSRLRPPTDARVRALQILTVLPTAALPLATGGDDMPVVALMLFGLVGLQRRRPFLAGLALGAASSLKFTAWPLALLALWAASDRTRRRARVGTRWVRGWSWARWFYPWPSPTPRPSSTMSSGSPSDWPGCRHRRPAPCPDTSWWRPFPASTGPMWWRSSSSGRRCWSGACADVRPAMPPRWPACPDG